MSVEEWETDGGATEPFIYLELSLSDMNYLMNRAQLDNTPRDRRILDAFRRAFLNGHDISPK